MGNTWYFIENYSAKKQKKKSSAIARTQRKIKNNWVASRKVLSL
jgi:hypothetical protein